MKGKFVCDDSIEEIRTIREWFREYPSSDNEAELFARIWHRFDAEIVGKDIRIFSDVYPNGHKYDLVDLMSDHLAKLIFDDEEDTRIEYCKLLYKKFASLQTKIEERLEYESEKNR